MSRLFCNLAEVLFAFCASRFRLSRPCLPLLRSSWLAYMDVEERRPIDGRGMMSSGGVNVGVEGRRLRLGRKYLR